ncbi:MAG: HD domain-containing protein [Pseudomonadota bacterium]
MEALAAALDARERETGLHSKRVACDTLVLAKHFTTDARQLRQVYWGALLHDIGKIGIPDAILLKDGELTESEWQIMRTHPDIGHRIVSSASFMADAARAEIVRQSGTQFDPQAVAIFVAEEATLRGMVELKCGAAHADMLRAGHGGFNAGDC